MLICLSPAQNLLSRIECHRKTRDEKVGERQAHQEVVVYASQLGIEDDAEDDKEVREDSDNNDQYQDYPFDNGGEIQMKSSQLTKCCIF